MITVQKHSEGTLQLLDKDRECVGWIYGPHGLKDGEILPVKFLTVNGDKIRVEVERPLSLVDALGKYFGFSMNYSTFGDSRDKQNLYAAWKREVEKEKTQ